MWPNDEEKRQKQAIHFLSFDGFRKIMRNMDPALQGKELEVVFMDGCKAMQKKSLEQARDLWESAIDESTGREFFYSR